MFKQHTVPPLNVRGTISRVMSRTAIYPGCLLPDSSSDLLEADGPPYASLRSCFGWGLHMPRPSPDGR